MSERDNLSLQWTPEELGMVLRMIRTRLRIRQAGFAELIGVSEDAVQRWETEGVPTQGINADLIRRFIIDHRGLVTIFLHKQYLSRREKKEMTDAARERLAGNLKGKGN